MEKSDNHITICCCCCCYLEEPVNIILCFEVNQVTNRKKQEVNTEIR